MTDKESIAARIRLLKYERQTKLAQLETERMKLGLDDIENELASMEAIMLETMLGESMDEWKYSNLSFRIKMPRLTIKNKGPQAIERLMKIVGPSYALKFIRTIPAKIEPQTLTNIRKALENLELVAKEQEIYDALGVAPNGEPELEIVIEA